MSDRQRVNAWNAMGLTFWVPLDYDREAELFADGRSSDVISPGPPSTNPVLLRSGDGPVGDEAFIETALKMQDVAPVKKLSPTLQVATIAPNKASDSRGQSESNVGSEVDGPNVPNVSAVTVSDAVSSQNIHFSAVWGVVVTRKLAFWADLGEPSAPGLSSAEAGLLWRIMKAIGVARHEVSQSQMIRWPFSPVDGSWRPELGDAGDMLGAFFDRYLKPEAPSLNALIFGDTLTKFSTLQRVFSFDACLDHDGADECAAPMCTEGRRMGAVVLPSLTAMLHCVEQKSLAWNVLKNFKNC